MTNTMLFYHMQNNIAKILATALLTGHFSMRPKQNLSTIQTVHSSNY